MKQIKLANGRGIALVNDEDFEMVSQHRWYLEQRKDIAYVYKNPNNNCPYRSMHRLIMSAKKGQGVDHRDRNGLNNQRHNLRFCTKSQNQMNSKKRKGTSRYKGVCWFKRDKNWTAYIMINYKRIHLGYFDDEIKAARAYNEKAVELFGEFARLNFIR